MTDLTLRDILINARQEAARMQHHFIGVEHLVAGALALRGGVGASVLETYGLKPDFVIDAIRRHSGKGSHQRLWAGVPYSPRADVVLSIANDIALEAGREEISERDLLRAVVEERNSIPVRVLRRLDVDLERFAEDVATYKPTTAVSSQPYVRVDFSPTYDSADALTEEHLYLLRGTFYGYDAVRVERRLTGGYSKALVLAVTPIQADGTEDAPVVVKINYADDILEEAQRYTQHVKATLPAMTARLEDRPIAPETTGLAALKYTLVAGLDRVPHDMRTAAPHLGMAQLGAWLRNDLYPTFGSAWWEQRRPYRFQAWQEYDFLLPPLFVLDALPSSEPTPSDAHFLRDPIRRDRLDRIEYGEVMVVAGFTVTHVYRDRGALQLAVGSGGEAARRAHKIEIRGVDLAQTAHFRGEVIDQIAGRVHATRAELLLNAVRALDPDFDPSGQTIPIFRSEMRTPNPLLKCNELLERHVDGTVSRLHGDLHLGNILLGPNQSAFLIDFASARSGHTLFDWATLEISLLNDLIMTQTGDSWADARRVIERLAALDGAETTPDPTIDDLLTPVEALREIVAHCLAQPDEKSEYWIALTFCALRAVTWETMDVGGRRLMFLLASYCCGRLQTQQGGGANDTLSQGPETDYSDGTSGDA